MAKVQITWRAEVMDNGTRRSTWHAFTPEGVAANPSVSLCGQHYAKVGPDMGLCMGHKALPAGDELCYYCKQRLEALSKQ
jgi:hypothetical protein